MALAHQIALWLRQLPWFHLKEAAAGLALNRPVVPRATPPPSRRPRGTVRIGVLMRRARVTSRSYVPEVVELLGQRGARVDVLDPGEHGTDLKSLRVEHDLYLVKDKSELGLSVAGALDAVGATLLNSFAVSLVLRNKIVTSRVLQAAGIPSPDAYVAAVPRDLAPYLEDGPLVVKPHRGSRGEGVRVVHNDAELGEWAPGDEPVFAQRFLPHRGPDLKLYAIGAELFGVRRPWPATTLEQKLGEPFTPGPELVSLMEQCRRAFGMDLFGIDVIESAGRPYVVDASSFPGFKGVPNAAARLAKFVYGVAEAGMRGEPAVPGTHLTRAAMVGLDRPRARV